MSAAISICVLGLMPAVAAFAQTSGAVVITEVKTERYDDNGRVTILAEFRNLTENLDLSRVVVTVNGVVVEGATVESITEGAEPVGIILLIDSSGSMLANNAIDAAKSAAKGFVDSKRPEDFIAVVTFASTVNVVSNFSNRAEDLKTRIDGIVASGDTALYRGVVTAADLFGSQQNIQKNMIILSDGANDDPGDATTLEDAIAAIVDEEVRTFGVALASGTFNPAEIQQIAEAGGGLFLSTPDPAQLDSLYAQIRRELGNTVVIRFNSPVSNPGDIELGVAYGDLSDAGSVTIPGYITTTTAGETTTTTFAKPAGSVVESSLPVEASTLKWLGIGGIAAFIGLFGFILFGAVASNDDGNFAKRLNAYGRKGPGGLEEQRPWLERLPLLRRFTAAAEEEVRKRGLLGALNNALEQGNIPLSAGESIAAAFGMAAVLGLVATLVKGSILVGLVVFGGIVFFTFMFIKFIGGREKKKFERQLPDTLTLTSTSLRAGYSLLQAIEAVAQEAPQPTGREFQRAIAEARLGRPVTEALNGITHRTQSKDFEWAVLAIDIQREVGGNLAEVLQTVADTMLSRNRLKGEIKALTAEGRISAYVLGCLPFAMGSFLWFSNPDYLAPLFTGIGWYMVGGGLVLILAGLIWLWKIVDIEV